MKTITKFATAALLAMSAVAPALATEPEALQLAERNTYLYTADARPIVQRQQSVQVPTHRGIEALAFAPTQGVYVKNQNAIY